MLNDRSSPLALLRTRRSSRPRDLTSPGPDAAEMQLIVEIAARTPDHGKLHPWRFVHVAREQRPAFAELLHRAYRAGNPEPSRLEIEAVDRLAFQAPELIVALFSPRTPSKIPVWEQELSCGAAIMNLIHATHALGYSAGWITGWGAYDDTVRAAFASGEDRIAGFLYIGTPGCIMEERQRPGIEEVFSTWDSQQLPLLE
jgi:nitroreductase